MFAWSCPWSSRMAQPGGFGVRGVDTWVGKTMFVPLIVRFCQRSGWTQFHVHNFLYLIGSYMLLMASLAKGPDDAGLAFAMALVFTFKCGRDPGYSGEPSTFLRFALLVLVPLHMLSHVLGKPLIFSGPDWDTSCPIGVMWLFAEYARTIKTIPPTEDRSTSPKPTEATP